MEIERFDKALAACKKSPRSRNVNKLLCDVVNYIFLKGYLFLLDINYDFEIVDKTYRVEDGNLTVAKIPSHIEGFLYCKDIPIKDIMDKSIKTSTKEITLKERIAYIEQLLFKIPRMED